MKWIIPGSLALDGLPGAERGAKAVSLDELDHWMVEIQRKRIRSILCLAQPDETPACELPLFRLYRGSGFQLVQQPISPGQEPGMTADQLQLAWSAYQRLAKPVLVQASCKTDERSQAVARFIAEQLGSELAGDCQPVQLAANI
jgi:hypothetical protein